MFRDRFLCEGRGLSIVLVIVLVKGKVSLSDSEFGCNYCYFSKILMEFGFCRFNCNLRFFFRINENDGLVFK